MSKKPETIINIKNLTKQFGGFKALDNLDLHIKKGEVHGFLGPNGAGKSTTIRILLGLLRKTTGEATLFGEDPWNNSQHLHKRLAYVPGDVALWPNLTGGEIIDLMARLRGGLDRSLRNSLCKRFDLDTTKKAHTYSKGNRQKVALVVALASKAELLILDEPTAGLDPLMEVVFQESIREIKSQGRTILLSSHILSQVEILADRISIIRNGSLVESGSLQSLRQLANTVVIAATEKPISHFSKLKGVHNLTKLPDQRIQFEIEASRLNSSIVQLTKAGITALEARPPTLEQLLLRHYNTDKTVREK